MQAATSVSTRRKRVSAGNALVEWMFVLLPTFALITAFFDVSFALFSWTTIANAVREGCRYAITFQTSGSLGQDASIEAVVQQYAMGFVTTTDTPQHIFVNYYAPTNLTTAIPFASGGNVPGNVVEVSVQNVSWAWIAPLSGTFVGNTRTPITFAV